MDTPFWSQNEVTVLINTVMDTRTVVRPLVIILQTKKKI